MPVTVPLAETVRSLRLGDRNRQPIATIRPSTAVEPGAKHAVQPRPVKVPHSERGRVTGLPARLVVHMYVNELTVDRGVAVPGVKASLTNIRWNALADFDIVHQ